MIYIVFVYFLFFDQWTLSSLVEVWVCLSWIINVVSIFCVIFLRAIPDKNVRRCVFECTFFQNQLPILFKMKFIWIVKTNLWTHHLSWKESLNSDGQQFYQYQQNEQSPLISTHWIKINLVVMKNCWMWWQNTSNSTQSY